jgi:hypothetical protein
LEETAEDLEDANELVKQQTQGELDGKGTMKYADGRVRVYVSLT